MHHHDAEVSWQRQGEPFTDNRYSRAHQWRFDGGAVVASSMNVDECLVRFLVELLNSFALDVGLSCVPKQSCESGATNFGRNEFCGEADLVEQ